MTVTTARQRVLAYLKKQRTGSAAQIGRALNMSAATVRHHLSVLRSDGRVTELEALHKEGRGRPVKVYGLSENLWGNNLALLADLLLKERLSKLPPAKRAEVIHRLAVGLTDQMGRIEADAPLAQRLAQLIERLNASKYEARWEAGSEGPRILFAHCPYAAIIAKHPELCAMDAGMLEAALEGSVRQTAKIGVDGSRVCAFQTTK